MVVLPRVTLLVFFTFARLAVTARAWSSSHSSFAVRLECGCFFLFCAETFAVCVHLWKEPSPSPLVQYSHTKFVQYLLPCCKPHTFGDGRSGFTTKKLKKQNEASGKRKRAWEQRRCERRGRKQRPAILRAVEPAAPSFVVFFVCSSWGSALVHHPQASKPGCFQHCQWSWRALTAVVHSALSFPILVVALRWQAQGKEQLFKYVNI